MRTRLIQVFSSGSIFETTTRVARADSQRGRNRKGSIRVMISRSAGSSVIARTAATAMAVFFVKASGLKSRPSCACNAKIGTNATAITSREKNDGPPTSLTASMITRW